MHIYIIYIYIHIYIYIYDIYSFVGMAKPRCKGNLHDISHYLVKDKKYQKDVFSVCV